MSDEIRVKKENVLKVYRMVENEGDMFNAELLQALFPEAFEKQEEKESELLTLVRNIFLHKSDLEYIEPKLNEFKQQIIDLFKKKTDETIAGQMIPTESLKTYNDLFSLAKKNFEDI